MSTASQFLSEVQQVWADLNISPKPILSPPRTKSWFFKDFNLVIRLIPLGEHLHGWDINTLIGFLESSPSGSQTIHIWEDLWKSNPKAVAGRIRSLLGHSHRIHGRDTEARRIEQPVLQEFLREHHTNVPLQAKYKYGLFQGEELVAIAAFSPIRTLKNEGDLQSSELLRFCNATGSTVVGGLSKLIKAFLKDKPQVQHLMTYADRDWSDGQGYEVLGFKRAGEKMPQKFWVDPDSYTRHYLNRLPINMKMPATWLPAYNLGSWKYVRTYIRL